MAKNADNNVVLLPRQYNDVQKERHIVCYKGTILLYLYVQGVQKNEPCIDTYVFAEIRI